MSKLFTAKHQIKSDNNITIVDQHTFRWVDHHMNIYVLNRPALKPLHMFSKRKYCSFEEQTSLCLVITHAVPVCVTSSFNAQYMFIDFQCSNTYAENLIV